MTQTTNNANALVNFLFGSVTMEQMKALVDDREGENTSAKMTEDEIVSKIFNTPQLFDRMFSLELDAAWSRARVALRGSFDTAVNMYCSSMGLKKSQMELSDIDFMLDKWHEVQWVRSVIGSLKERKTVMNLEENDLNRVVRFYQQNGSNETIVGSSYDEKLQYIKEESASFERKWFTEEVVKPTLRMLKMSHMDLEYNQAYGCYSFDSSKAQDLVNGKSASGVHGDEYSETMIWVQTAEDGLTRICQKYGLDSFVCNFDAKSEDPQEQASIEEKNFECFYRGVVDVVTGKRYMFTWQGPSATRKADAKFVECRVDGLEPEDMWRENILPLWLEGTGLTEERLFAEFIKDGKFVPNKLNARLAVRSSDTLPIGILSPEWDKEIRQWNVSYFTDPEVHVDRPNKRLAGTSLVTVNEGHDVTPGDGAGIISMSSAAQLAAAIRRISDAECGRFRIMLAKAHGEVDKLHKNGEFLRILNKIPMVFQFRRESTIEKGTLVVLKDSAMPKDENGMRYDACIPDSVVKCMGLSWGEGSIEICGYLHGKKNYVTLGNQFLQALQNEPTALNPIIEDWFDVLRKATETSEEGIRNAMAFYNVIGDASENDTLLQAALRSNQRLLNDPQIVRLANKQIDKFIDEMYAGRIRVPGMYTYMVCDPASVINMAYGTENKCLASGQYYFNGKSCKAGLFRSPMVAPSQAITVDLVNSDVYWYMKDAMIFNAFDGAWDRMSGADFDGDTCAVVPSDTWQGQIIVDGIVDPGYDVCEPKGSAQKYEWSFKNYCDFMKSHIRRDRTGEITNYNSHAVEIYNHLRGVKYLANLKGVTDVEFYLPTDQNVNRVLPHYNEYGEREDNIDLFRTRLARVPFAKDGVLYCPGFKVRKRILDKTTGSKNWSFIDREDDIIGRFSVDQLDALAQKYLDTTEHLCALQGIEIDGAKTGRYPTDEEYTEIDKVPYTTQQQIARKAMLGRAISGNDWHNTYYSLSILGTAHAKTLALEKDFRENYQSQTQSYAPYLWTLLTNEERAQFERPIRFGNDTVLTLRQYIEQRAVDYNTRIAKAMSSSAEADDKNAGISAIKDLVRNGGEQDGVHCFGIAELVNYGFTIEALSACCYIVAYDKTDSQNRGLSFGWLFWEDLCALFSRGNHATQLIRINKNADTAYVLDEVLYVNDKPSRNIKAHDCVACEMIELNGSLYAQVSMKVDNIVDNKEASDVVDGQIFTLTIVGFDRNIVGVPDAKRAWKDIVINNGFKFDVVMSSQDYLMSAVDGNMIGAIKGKDSFKLLGHTVKCVNNSADPIKESAKSIMNFKVVVIK